MSMMTVLKTDENMLAQPKNLSEALKKLLLAFGGEESFFMPEEKMVFLLDLTLPADQKEGVNFDIRLAYSLVDAARRHGVKDIIFAFRPEAGFDGDVVLEKSGYAALKVIPGVQFIDLSKEEMVKRSSLTALSADELPVYKPLLLADVIISLVKFRAAEGRLFGSALHHMAVVSSAVDGVEQEQRERMLVDLYDVISPDLFIVDGIRGKGGFQSHQSDCLMAAADAVAADAVLAALGGISIDTVGSLCLGAQYGLGMGDPSGISLYGDDLSEIMKPKQK